MEESSSTFKDPYTTSNITCIHCGKAPVRKGKTTISEDLEFIRIRWYCRAIGCGRQFDSVYRFLDFDEPEERKYGAP